MDRNTIDTSEQTSKLGLWKGIKKLLLDNSLSAEAATYKKAPVKTTIVKNLYYSEPETNGRHISLLDFLQGKDIPKFLGGEIIKYDEDGKIIGHTILN